MDSRKTKRKYLIALDAPESMRLSMEKASLQWKRTEILPLPFPPFIPLLETEQLPPPPVTGLLPACNKPVQFLTRPVLIPRPDCWILPLQDEQQFTALKEALEKLLHKNSKFSASRCSALLPAGKGVPLGIQTGPGTPELPEVEIHSGWRAMKLVCREIEYSSESKWFMLLRWRTLWERRLRRAPAAAERMDKCLRQNNKPVIL
ncbi:MAG: hypothetical protein CSA76_01065 [Spirochaetales bacterium]|nr:MAG: hypothetical protein CSA76_01065 [Spirochaetales bacterium]